MGGAFETSIAVNFDMPAGVARVVSFTFTAAAKTLFLPPIDDSRVRVGWPFMFIHNAGELAFLLADQDGQGIADNIQSGFVADVSVAVENGARKWVEFKRRIRTP